MKVHDGALGWRRSPVYQYTIENNYNNTDGYMGGRCRSMWFDANKMLTVKQVKMMPGAGEN